MKIKPQYAVLELDTQRGTIKKKGTFYSLIDAKNEGSGSLELLWVGILSIVHDFSGYAFHINAALKEEIEEFQELYPKKVDEYIQLHKITKVEYYRSW